MIEVVMLEIVLTIQIVGGYGVPAIACAVSLCFPVIDNLHSLLAQAMAGTP